MDGGRSRRDEGIRMVEGVLGVRRQVIVGGRNRVHGRDGGRLAGGRSRSDGGIRILGVRIGGKGV